jgi:hypothetical protein
MPPMILWVVETRWTFLRRSTRDVFIDLIRVLSLDRNKKMGRPVYFDLAQKYKTN